jgi:hypothetical protein
MEPKYKYTLIKILQHMICLEEHFIEDICYECICKHSLALQMYLEEMSTFCYTQDKIYWISTKKMFDYWFNDLHINNERLYSEQVRKVRKEIMNKFYLDDFLHKANISKKIGACCK